MSKRDLTPASGRSGAGEPIARKSIPAASPEEQQKARAMELTVEVYRLQERLRRLPLVPRKPWLRKVRNRLVAELYEAGRRGRCLEKINPWAASDSRVPPSFPY